MDATEIEALVKSGADLPEGLNIAESCYFLSIEYLRRTRLSPEEKESRYNKVRESFDESLRAMSIYQDTCRMRVRIASIAKEMTVGDCPICKKAIAIFDGRDK
ncbi:MAG TPA: hypothetical protein VHP31_08680 [Caproicibacter sp.]|nr:hypothetical protein [Caproicibacter sp.]